MAKPVFISYATEDSEIAHQVCGFLERKGLACWIAPRDVRPGFDCTDEIMEGIEGTRAVVLLQRPDRQPRHEASPAPEPARPPHRPEAETAAPPAP